MLAIAGEIVIVVLAAAAGAGAGWLLARRGRVRVVAAVREEATTGTLSLADDLYARTQRLHALETRLARAQEQLAGRTGALAATTERVKAMNRPRSRAASSQRSSTSARGSPRASPSWSPASRSSSRCSTACAGRKRRWPKPRRG